MAVLLFLTFAAIAVLCALNLVLQTHPISSALSLIGVLGSVAILYLLLGGEFVAAVQLIVYAGAIMVLFVFVIMLLNAGAERRPTRKVVATWISLPLLFTFIALAAMLIGAQVPKTDTVTFGGFSGGTTLSVGRALFTQYLLPFEVTSILILVAILGAVVLARKEI
jgi:NADH-quinone oxidoreductase subunit J